MLLRRAARLRQFDIEDNLIEDFLENDIEQLLRHDVRTMGMDIELARRFGTFDMKAVIREVQQDYQQQIAKTRDPAKREALESAK